MKNKRILIIISILILVGLLSACSGATANPTSWPGVTVDLENETVYVANNQHVYAVNLSNGSEKWRFPQEADNKISFFAAPALTEDDQLVVGGYNNILYSIDPTSGSQFWAYEDATDKFIAGSLASDQQPGLHCFCMQTEAMQSAPQISSGYSVFLIEGSHIPRWLES